MAFNWQSLIGTGATVAGGVAGGVLGGVPGAAVGASLGGAAGGLINAAFNLAEDTPAFMGPSEEERALLARQMDLSNQLSNIEGLTPQQVSNLMNASLEHDLFTQQAVNAFQSVNRLSPLEKQILEDRLTSQRMSRQEDVITQLVSADAGIQGQRVAQALSATGQAFGAAAAVRREERMQEQQEINFERQQLQAFDQALQAAGMTAMSAGLLYDKMFGKGSPDVKAEAEYQKDKAVVSERAAAMPGVSAVDTKVVPSSGLTMTEAEMDIENYKRRSLGISSPLPYDASLIVTEDNWLDLQAVRNMGIIV